MYKILSMGKSPSLCPNNYRSILSKEECLQAAKDLKLSNPRKDFMNFNESYAPPGCLSYKFNNTTFWFNPSTTQPMNRSWGNVAPVCKKKSGDLDALDLVSVPVYNQFKKKLKNLVGLKSAKDAEYAGILSDQQYKLGQRAIKAGTENTKLQTDATNNENAAITKHNTSVDNANTQYDALVKEKADLQKKFNELNADLQKKIAEISELAAKLMKIKADKEEAIRIIKEQIAKVRKLYEAELARLNIQKKALDEKIKKFNEYQATLNAEEQKFVVLDNKFQSQLSKLNEINVLIDDLNKEKVVLDTEYAVWQAKFSALESDFRAIEEKISKYLKKGENELEYLNDLLKEKRIVQDKLFAYSEDKYNSQTHLVDDVNLEMSPSELLENNQGREIVKNTSKFDKLKTDIMSISKNIQINKNEYRKKSFYIFLLTHAFIFLIITLIIVILMRNGII